MSGKKNYWTPDQDDFIRNHWKEMDDSELAEKVGHTISSTTSRRQKLRCIKQKGTRGPDWTEEELSYLHNSWGEKTIPQIAKELGRSINAVKVMAFRTGHKCQKQSGNMMSARKVAEILGVDVQVICDSWIPKYRLKGKKLRLGLGKRKTTIIMFDDLIRWLKKHQDLWDSRKVEQYGLGIEYDWLIKKREADEEKPARKSKLWTKVDDARLIHFVKTTKMTYKEIGKELGRSEIAVAHRLRRLDVWGTGQYIGKEKPKPKG